MRDKSVKHNGVGGGTMIKTTFCSRADKKKGYDIFVEFAFDSSSLESITRQFC